MGGGGACSGGNRIPVTAGHSYTWSGWLLVPAGTNLGSARIRVAWYAACAGGIQISTNDSTVVTTASGGWTQLSGTAAAPSSAAFAEVRLYAAPAASRAVTVDFDDVTLR